MDTWCQLYLRVTVEKVQPSVIWIRVSQVLEYKEKENKAR